MTALIEAFQLYKSFGNQVAVDGVDLMVQAGEIYGLVGPDGAGKTTTLRLLCGAMRPTLPHAPACRIEIAGFDLAHQVELARSQIGYLPQRFSMYEELTVLENLRFFAEVRGLKAQDWRPRCMEILEFVGLEPFTDRRAGLLSGGMKQKLGLAVALVHTPKVLLLDEPTTGVDPVTRQDFWQLIIRLVAEDKIAVLISTPYMDEAARCGRVGFMRLGKVILEGSPEALRKRLENRIVEVTGQPLVLLRKIAATDEDVEDAQMFGDRLHLRTRPNRSQAAVARLKRAIPAGGGKYTQIRQVPAQLEDVFIALLEKKA
jgi:ABC-2 type transport system ATP-binding protein